MSNYILDGVIAEDMKSAVWSRVVKDACVSIVWNSGEVDVNPTMMKLGQRVKAEQDSAVGQVNAMDMGEREADNLRGKIFKEVGNIVKNYFPVIKRTLKDGLNLLDENDDPIPKSQMEKNYKAKDMSDADSKTPEEKAIIMGRTLKEFCKKHSLDVNDYISLMSAVNTTGVK